MNEIEKILEESPNAEEALRRLIAAGVPEAVAWEMADVAFGGSGDVVEVEEP